MSLTEAKMALKDAKCDGLLKVKPDFQSFALTKNSPPCRQSVIYAEALRLSKTFLQPLTIRSTIVLSCTTIRCAR